MSVARAARRPRLALPFAILHGPDLVRLVAGEDHRYTLRAPGLDQWLPELLGRLDGRRGLAELLATVASPHQPDAAQLIERLYGERVLVEGAPEAAHSAVMRRLTLFGQGPIFDILGAASDPDAADELPVLCQDRLDLAQAFAFNRSCLARNTPWLWVSCGALSRGYVSPPFLPGGGPCLRCLLSGFRDLSPVPEIHDDLLAHAERGGMIPPGAFPAPAAAILANLVLWKRALLAEATPAAALYRLHVAEVASLEVRSYPVLFDPQCPDCA